MKKERPYKPISCSFHDELEAIAVKQKHVEINFLDPNEMQQTVKSQIKDLISKNGIEFMLLKDNTLVRLDWIISVDGKEMASYC